MGQPLRCPPPRLQARCGSRSAPSAAQAPAWPGEASSVPRKPALISAFHKPPPPGQHFFAGINGHKNTALPYGGRLIWFPNYSFNVINGCRWPITKICTIINHICNRKPIFICMYMHYGTLLTVFEYYNTMLFYCRQHKQSPSLVLFPQLL